MRSMWPGNNDGVVQKVSKQIPRYFDSTFASEKSEQRLSFPITEVWANRWIPTFSPRRIYVNIVRLHL
jgi:hypothetical protein